MLAARGGKAGQLPKPPQFARMFMPIKMMTMAESLDGLKFDIAAGISPKFQLGASWFFSNSKPANFSLMTTYTGIPDSVIDAMMNHVPGSPPPSPPNQDEISVIQAKKDSGGRLEFHSQYPLGAGLSLRGEGLMAKADP
jgi:hypothetical protein